jgi:hypothetical protein
MGMAPLKEQCNLHTWMVDASMEVDGGTGFGSSADDLALSRQALRAPGYAGMQGDHLHAGDDARNQG